jgi:hypothetical protein
MVQLLFALLSDLDLDATVLRFSSPFKSGSTKYSKLEKVIASERKTNTRLRHRRFDAGTVVAYQVRGACIAASQPVHARFGSKAEVTARHVEVCFTPETGHRLTN